jgi:hypothetical protein
MTQIVVLPSKARVSLAAAEVASRPAGANSGWNCMSNKAMTATVAVLSMIADDDQPTPRQEFRQRVST